MAQALTIPDELRAARIWAQARLRYMGHAIMALQPYPVPGLGSACVDKYYRMAYDPQWVKTLAVEDLGFVVAHETLHPYLGHYARLVGLPQEVRNVAFDLSINSMLRSTGMKPPAGLLLPEEFGFPDGLSAEEYAELLLRKEEEEEERKQQQQQQDPGDSGDGDEGPESGDSSDGDSSDSDSGDGDSGDEGEDSESGDSGDGDEGPESGDSSDGDEGSESGDSGDGDEGSESGDSGDGDEGSESGDSGNGDEGKDGSGGAGGAGSGNSGDTGTIDRRKGQGGSGSDGEPKPWELPPPKECPEDCEAPGLDGVEKERIDRVTSQEIEETERGRGGVPGGLRRHAKKMLHPAVDPVQAIVTRLRHAIASRPGLGEFNYRRLSRRVPPETAILPSNRRPIPRITVIIDTSASMEGQDISLALGAVALVCRGLPDPRGLKVIAGDTQAQACARVFRPENVALKGGGGTHMGYIVREEAKETPKPSVILVITDGYTPWLSQHEMNGIRLIVCLTQRANKGMVPTWAETVMLCGD